MAVNNERNAQLLQKLEREFVLYALTWQVIRSFIKGRGDMAETLNNVSYARIYRRHNWHRPTVGSRQMLYAEPNARSDCELRDGDIEKSDRQKLHFTERHQ